MVPFFKSLEIRITTFSPFPFLPPKPHIYSSFPSSPSNSQPLLYIIAIECTDRHIPKYNLFSPPQCYLCDFQADRWALANQLVCSSVGKVTSSVPSFPQFPIGFSGFFGMDWWQSWKSLLRWIKPHRFQDSWLMLPVWDASTWILTLTQI